MDFKTYKSLLAKIVVGKSLPDAMYVHISAIDTLPKELSILIGRILTGLKIKNGSWNIIKLMKRDFRIALLNYPDFDSYAYPALVQSTNIDLEKVSVRTTSYQDSKNPPILHRKETFVKADYPFFELFKEITEEGEAAGLFENTRSIGFKQNWLKLIRTKGLSLDDSGRLIGEAKPYIETSEEIDVQRHLTAIERNKLSAPMQLLAKHGYLDGEFSIFDYGCGKGDDVRELEAHGLDINSYDPVYHPEGNIVESDIVNLGFVINVIEDKQERIDTLAKAFALAQKALVVSAMLGGESLTRQFTPYKDGIITSKNTFQKYYSQSELKHFIENSLAEQAFALGQGIFIVFKKEDDAQEFLLKRQSYKREWQHKLIKSPKSVSNEFNEAKYQKHKALFDAFWKLTLDLGRCPANDEFEQTEQIRKVTGSHKKALDGLTTLFGEEEFKFSRRLRKEDLLVYFSLGLFEKRKAYSHMPDRLKRDLKAFFKSYNQAIELATEMLFSLASTDLIEETSVLSKERIGCGEIFENHSFIFHSNYLGQVTPELRAYVGCAAQLLGDIDEFDLIKAHFGSGKVSFMKYDDFSKNEPLLIKRVKVRLRDLDFDTFEYGGVYKSTPLEDKATFVCKGI